MAIFLALGACTGGGGDGDDDAAVENGGDDDGPPTLAIGDVSVIEGESAVFEVTLSGETELTVTVDYATAAGTAEAGTDYTAPEPGTLTFQPGEFSKSITVETIADGLYEGTDETLTVALNGESNATLSATASDATGTISDVDPIPTVSIADASAFESDGTIVFTVSLGGRTVADTTVVYTTANGTAEAGSDFTEATGFVTIASLETTATTSVALVNDNVHEVEEAFTVTLSEPSAGSLED
ncbi:MAG: hypothetical protein IID61_15835, partial [SAR324 cluster bacterium]|nr:hypothetical protein [SAR324 cluster bacterium]